MFQVYRDLVSRIAAVIDDGLNNSRAGRAANGTDVLNIRLEDLDEIVQGIEPQGISPALGAVFVVGRDGHLRSLNAPARDRFGLRAGQSLAEAAVSRPRLADALRAADPAAPPVGLLVADHQANPVALIALGLPDGKHVLVFEVAADLSPAALRALAAVYGLGKSEQDVLALLVGGHGPESCAAVLGRTLGTVRQQIKGLLSKMAVHSQAQAIARAFAMAQTVDRLSVAVQAGMTAPALSALIDTPAGVVAYQRFGQAGGMPVLMFHGALTGISPMPQIRLAAATLGLDIVAPERPGYGATPLPQGADPVALALDHARRCLDAAGISGRVMVLGHDIGSKFACAFARAFPARVAGVVLGPTTPPMKGWAQTADMPTRHRVNAWAAQKMPALMDRIVALGIAQIHRKGVEIIPALIYADCDFDRAVVSRPEVMVAMHEVFALVAQQDAAGLRHDMRLTNLDWSDWCAEIAAPVVALHGDQSATVSRAAVARLVEDFPNARLVDVPGGGHSLALALPEVIFRQVYRLGVEAGL